MQDTNSKNYRRYRHHQLADTILSYLALEKSNIRMLVFNPDHGYGSAKLSGRDAWGHTWPFYAYERAICRPVSSSIDRTVAIAVKFEDINILEKFHVHVCLPFIREGVRDPNVF